MGLKSLSASSVSVILVLCCCSKARRASNRDCVRSRSALRRCSSSSVEFARARLEFMSGVRWDSEAWIAECVVAGLERYAFCRAGVDKK